MTHHHVATGGRVCLNPSRCLARHGGSNSVDTENLELCSPVWKSLATGGYRALEVWPAEMQMCCECEMHTGFCVNVNYINNFLY